MLFNCREAKAHEIVDADQWSVWFNHKAIHMNCADCRALKQDVTLLAGGLLKSLSGVMD